MVIVSFGFGTLSLKACLQPLGRRVAKQGERDECGWFHNVGGVDAARFHEFSLVL